MRSKWSLLLTVTLWTTWVTLSSTEVDFTYHNTNELEKFLKDTVLQYPDLTNLYSIGKSVQGRELWVLALGANANRHEHLRPEVKFVGNMHGNEVTGREMLIHLVDHLLTNYYLNGTVKQLLDSTRIHILVSMNPDGFENATQYIQLFNRRRCGGIVGRYNARGYDLNRNFPDFFEPTTHAQQPETTSAIAWFSNNSFVLSANLHDGSLVANYPYDNYADATRNGLLPRYSASPDDDIFRHLARTYSHYHKTMHFGDSCDGSKNKFPGGITNGADWYPVKGGMQDYNYIYQGTFELTLELSCCKYPPESQLEGLWDQNKDALVAYLLTVHMGIKGVVKDTAGKPIEGAEVKVKDRVHPMHTTKDGEYWRLLLPGKTYTIQVYKPNSQYIPVERDVTLHDFNPVIVNFTLETRQASQNSVPNGNGATYRRLANSLSPPVFLYWMYYYS